MLGRGYRNEAISEGARRSGRTCGGSWFSLFFIGGGLKQRSLLGASKKGAQSSLIGCFLSSTFIFFGVRFAPLTASCDQQKGGEKRVLLRKSTGSLGHVMAHCSLGSMRLVSSHCSLASGPLLRPHFGVSSWNLAFADFHLLFFFRAHLFRKNNTHARGVWPLREMFLEGRPPSNRTGCFTIPGLRRGIHQNLGVRPS